MNEHQRRTARANPGALVGYTRAPSDREPRPPAVWKTHGGPYLKIACDGAYTVAETCPRVVSKPMAAACLDGIDTEHGEMGRCGADDDAISDAIDEHVRIPGGIDGKLLAALEAGVYLDYEARMRDVRTLLRSIAFQLDAMPTAGAADATDRKRLHALRESLRDAYFCAFLPRKVGGGGTLLHLGPDRDV